MGRRKQDWQDTKYVLTYFDRALGRARKKYLEYVKPGIEKGRRPELVGGGLIRSLGGWQEVRRYPLGRQDRIKTDERILGDSDFVNQVLFDAEETFERRYRVKSLGYGFKVIVKKVLGLYDIEKSDLYSGSRRKPIPDARSLLCYWAVHELGLTRLYLSEQLGLTPQAVGYAVTRGKKVVEKNDFRLIE